MDELKMHIRYVMLLELKNNKSTTETAKKICSTQDQDVITDWFSKFHSGLVGLVVSVFYDISTFVGYSMTNPFLFK